MKKNFTRMISLLIMLLVSVTTNARKMEAGKWNTLVLPQSLTTAQIAEVYGNGTLLYTFSHVDGDKAVFVPATAIEAGKAYLIMPTQVPENDGLLDNGLVDRTGQMVGSLGQTMLKEGDYYLYANDRKLHRYPFKKELKVPAARCILTGLASTANVLELSFAGEPTAITNIESSQKANNNGVYNMAGQKTNKNGRGIKIANGHKSVK